MSSQGNKTEIRGLSQAPQMIQFSIDIHKSQTEIKSWTKSDASKLTSFTQIPRPENQEASQQASQIYQDDDDFIRQIVANKETYNKKAKVSNQDDLLITEKGLELEEKIAKYEIGGKGSALRSSAISLINKEHILFTPYFHIPKYEVTIAEGKMAKAFVENLLEKRDALKILKNQSFARERGFHNKPKHARFKGLCPYSYNQAFYMSPDSKKLLKGTFKGGKLVEQSELQLHQNDMQTQKNQTGRRISIVGRQVDNKTVTSIKVLGGFYVAIGYFDGSFQLITLKSEQAEILTVKSAGNKEFVRDFHLYQKPGSSERFLVVLYVDQNDDSRTYLVSQFYIKNMKIKLSSKHTELFSTNNDDEKSSRFEHRREFSWLEKFRPLGSHCISFQLNKSSVAILDLKQSTKLASAASLSKNKQTIFEMQLFQKGFQSGNDLNWTFLAPEQPSQFLLEDELNLTLINSNGIFSVSFQSDGSVQSTQLSNQDNSDDFAIESWKPFDVLTLQNDILMVAGTMGLYKLKFNSQTELTIEKLESDKFYQLNLSYCGRIIAATGRSKSIELFKAPSKILQDGDPTNDVHKLCQLPYNNVFCLVMTSEQIFFQFKPLGCWVILDLQSSQIVRTQEPRIRINNKGKKIQKVLYDKVEGDDKDYTVGIISKETEFYPDKNFSQNIIGFKGGAVSAIDLNQESDTKPTEIILMSKKEAESGFIVLSVILHKTKLSWIVASTADSETKYYLPDQIYVKVRQEDLGVPNSQKQVDLNSHQLDFALFSGFYLTMIRDNPYFSPNTCKPLVGKNGDCILTSCDSREQDLRQFDTKEYLLIKFTEASMVQNSVDLSIQMPLTITQEISAFSAKSEANMSRNSLASASMLSGLRKSLTERINVSEIEVPNKTCFILNDGTACKLIDPQGKHIFTKIHGKKADQKDKIRKWKIGAQELKISPKGNRIVFEKDNQCYVAELNLEYENDKCKEDQKDACGAEQFQKLLNKWPLLTTTESPGLSNLKTVFWLSNDYFAVGDFIDENQESHSYSVFRSTNGQILCRFYLSGDYEFLKFSTGPNLHCSNITGILDKTTNKIYDTSFVSLLQLGAKRFTLRPKPLWQKQSLLIEKSDKIMVLNCLAPSLFFQNLLNLHNHRLDIAKQREIVNYRVMCSTVVETISEELFGSQNDTMVVRKNLTRKMIVKRHLSTKIQNLFQHLCKHNEAELLKSFLVEESNYFSDGISPSPVSETTVVCSKVVNNWLLNIDENRANEIYSGFDMQDLNSIAKLPITKVERICENLTYNFSKTIKFSSAILKENAFAKIDNHEKLANISDQNRIIRKLFECDETLGVDISNVNDDVGIIPKRGVPFNIYITLMKFPLHPGSVASKNLLDRIKTAGEENNNIYLIKLIQKLLDYKRKQVWFAKVVLISTHLSYLLCCMYMPYSHKTMNDIESLGESLAYMTQEEQLEAMQQLRAKKTTPIHTMILVFGIIFLSREVIAMKAMYHRRMQRKGEINLLQSIRDYFNVWNVLDWINIVSMICYFFNTKASFYALMVLITWLNMLQYMRYLSFFRFFIDLIKNIFTDSETWKFLIVLSIMTCAFASSYLLLDLQETCRHNPDIDCDSFLDQYRAFTFTSFGDFGASEGLNEDGIDQNNIQWALFMFSVFTMCIVMLNLLIGILSKAMEDILENKTQTEYAAICQIVYDLEVFMSARIWYFCNCSKKQKQENMHLIFAEPILEEIEEQFEVQTAFENLEKKQEQTMTEVNQTRAEVKQLSDKLDNLIANLPNIQN